MSTASVSTVENLTLNITQEVRVRASLEDTFEALLEQLGPSNVTPEGQPLPLTLEPWPGGRWFRDLGGRNGHFWGQVQAIKRPGLLEITGPLFMSAPVASNVQYRLQAVEDGTLLRFRHTAFGLIPDDVRAGIARGWTTVLEGIRMRCEQAFETH
jgi:hypothetical protein